MKLIVVSSLLGVALFSLHTAALEGPFVDVWPSQSEVYLGESVLLHCRLESNVSSAWTYRWYRHKPNTTLTLNLRHSVCDDSYFITAVTHQDAGSYWCRAEQRERNITTEVEVQLKVSDGAPSGLLPPSPALTPSSRQVFSGERFTVLCPASTNSSDWKLWHFSPEGKSKRQMCADHSEACVFVAERGNSGLYWCEGAEGRSRALNITVSYGNIILKTPAFSVRQGATVVLYCQYRTGHHNESIFFKNGLAINTSETAINLTMEKVTQEEEGLYKCGSRDRKMESKESWLSVILDGDNFTSKAETSAGDSWKWVVPFIVVLLLLILLSVWLVQYNRYRTLHTRSCWVFSKEDIPAVPLPVTRQDVTEVQWDLSWMEMSNLLDKNLYPDT